MKLVGDAFKENASSIYSSKKVVVLGIANWPTVKNKESLTKSKSIRGREPAEYSNSGGEDKHYKTQYLNPYHTHFLLVDSASYKYGGEVAFRSHIEAAIARNETVGGVKVSEEEEKQQRRKSDTCSKIPIVVVAVGGGPRTIQTILESVKKDTPCVILEV